MVIRSLSFLIELLHPSVMMTPFVLCSATRRGRALVLLVLPLLICLASPLQCEAQTSSAMRRLPDAPWTARSESVAYSNPQAQSVRTPQGRVLVPAGSLWVYGSRGRSDVWVSTNGATTWMQAGGEGTVYGGGVNGGSWATDLRRSADCDDPVTGRMYCISGQNATGEATSRAVGSSNGYQWEELTGEAAFWRREEPACAVDYASTVFLYGGSTAVRGALPLVSSNDVWRSRDLGSTWELVTERAAFPRRINADAAILNGTAIGVPQGVHLLMNGDGRLGTADALLNDLWMSSTGGQTWHAVTRKAPFSARKDSELTVTGNGILIVTGGMMGRRRGMTCSPAWTGG